ncbi:glutathione-disulfide reductase [Sinirhodobacter populi]|uniref:Glutathione-disulfide reductase n=1 Tax=Paenirhodobacter populi TaxID=2306993 RepID=A0A443K8Z3_9RHOB|nr:glutathione-disulfide reductase [Sinirhodobacter populi]RWR29215.1 glutathione-disulfide reductase [Sinirhodobacter populi]
MSFDYDLFVIGGGSGGVRAARIAAGEYGARVALAEEYRMGGTCVIRGCVPKKLMVYASSVPTMAEEARGYGWSTEVGRFDWQAFRAKLEAELDRLEAIYRKGQTGAGVTVHDQRATVIGPHEVRLADGTEISAKHILVAVGDVPFVPEFEGREHVLTSNDMFKLDALPRRLLIVGGGYIAVEFACIMEGLGVQVTVWNRSPLMRYFDRECADLVTEQMQARGIATRIGVTVDRVRKTAEGLAVTGGEITQTFDAVLYATGRVPNTKGLGLDAAGVKLAVNGAVMVDDWSQTNVPSIYAVGDVTDRIALTPVAIREGHAFADTVFGAKPRRMDHDLVPSAVFTRPEFGTCGLTEEIARAQEEIEVYATSFRPMRSSFAGSPDKVLMKLVVSKTTRKVLGCHIVAPDAGEMIQLAAIAMKMGATKEQFDATCAVHPTMAEELVTLRKPVR